MAENLYKEILDHTPNHYELLGLKLFESDPEKIKKASLTQSKKIKDWALAPDQNTANEVQHLRKLVDTAITILEDEKKKEKYDNELAEELGVTRKKEKSPGKKNKKPSLTFSQPITCPSCHTANEPDQKKCSQCEKSLLQTCPNCKRQTPIDNAYCFYCKTLIKKINRQERQKTEKKQQAKSGRHLGGQSQ